MRKLLSAFLIAVMALVAMTASVPVKAATVRADECDGLDADMRVANSNLSAVNVTLAGFQFAVSQDIANGYSDPGSSYNWQFQADVAACVNWGNQAAYWNGEIDHINEQMHIYHCA